MNIDLGLVLLISLGVLLMCRSQRRTIVIEPRNVEKFSQADSTIRKNRFLAKNKQDNVDCSCGRYCSCGGTPDRWATKYEPGANGVVDDLQWHTMSPRMILQDNCIRQDPNRRYNAPVGVDTDGGRVDGVNSRVIGSIFNNAETVQVEAEDIDRSKHTMSAPIGTGIRKQPEDELTKLVDW